MFARTSAAPFDVAHATALSARSMPSRVAFAALVAFASLVFLDWRYGLTWFCAVAAWELGLRPLRDRIVLAAPAKRALYLFALTAGLSALVFSSFGAAMMRVGGLGLLFGGTVLAGSMTHILVYYASSRLVLAATLGPALAATAYGAVGAYGLSLEALVAVFAVVSLLTGSSLFLADRDTLQRELSEKSVALSVAEQANAAKSQFIAIMTHELRTPLNAIIGYGEILREDIEDARPPALQDADRILSASRHLLMLVNDVLDFSKLEAGRFDLDLDAIDPQRVIDQALDSVRPAAERKGLHVTVAVEAGAGPVLADAKRLRQCLINLLGNAVKFTPRGSVRVLCRAESEDQAALIVEDTGVGIAEKDRAALFQPFSQIDGGKTRQHDGTGLGLAITERLMKQMGGLVRVESALGKGSRFSLIVPRATPRAMAAHSAAA